ncbi:Tuberin-like protein, partial [Dinothrombium tinctorium]
CKTPQKTPSKLDNIPEQGGHSGHRERVHTISVMSPAQKGNLKRLPLFQKSTGTVPRSSGLSPAFVFLQFFYNTSTNAGEKPILLPRNDPTIAATFNVIDFTLPYETHKIGVVYIGPGQIEDCVTIMSNTAGSLRYTAFLKGLGNLIRLSSVKPEQIYLGGLTTDGSDGQFAFYWEDRLTQVIFHVATLIPNKSTDPQRNNKKKHIGNDYVVIVYNDSGEDFSLTTLKGRGQFTYVCIVITPTDYQTNRVHFQTIPEVSDLIGHKYPVMVSDTVLPHFVRQLSIQANLACLVYKWRCTNPSSPYTSNSVERLRKIKSLRQKALKLNANEYNINANSQGYKLPPFNDYAAAESEKFGTNQPTHFAFPDDFTNYV